MLPFELNNHWEPWTAEYMFQFCSSKWQCIERERKITALFIPFTVKCIGSVQQSTKGNSDKNLNEKKFHIRSIKSKIKLKKHSSLDFGCIWFIGHNEC